jgi:hypothetical protein
MKDIGYYKKLLEKYRTLSVDWVLPKFNHVGGSFSDSVDNAMRKK